MNRRFAAMAIGLGGILYAAWFLQWFVPTNLPAMSSYISELSAGDQPHHWFFRTTDLLAGISLILGSMAALRSTPRSRWMVAGWTSLLLFGLSTIADSQSPMRCAATVSASCARLGELDELGWANSLHAFTSAGEDFFFGLAMLSLMIVARRSGARIGLRKVATVVAVAVVASWAWTFAATAEFELWGLDDRLGLAQRTEVTLIGVWLVLLSVAMSPIPSTDRRLFTRRGSGSHVEDTPHL